MYRIPNTNCSAVKIYYNDECFVLTMNQPKVLYF